jgi:UDP-N-acetylmuramoylalanine--D-glutamate ligase
MTGAFEGRHVVVLGAGVAGRAAASALLAEGARVRLTDDRDADDLGDLGDLRTLGADVCLGGHRSDDLEGVDLVVTSPGIPPTVPVFDLAAARGVEVWGELELGARLTTVPYLAVTGTNGKTTTTGMLASCLQAAGFDAAACGNIGFPFPTAARAGFDVLVVEASSFQLERHTTFHPRVSVLLNLAPDHLDHHGAYPAYRDAKARVFVCQGPGDVHIGNADDEAAAAVSRTAPCDVRWTSIVDRPTQVGSVGVDAGELVALTDVGAIPLGVVDDGRAGSRADAAAAAAAALAFGVGIEAVAAGLATYEPEAHRGEEVVEVDGVRFVDNSKATNVHAALAAIGGVRDAVLIAGGRAKGQDLAALGGGAAHLRAVVAIGEAADDIVGVFADLVVAERAASIEEATRRAFALAARPGVVLLAPACASWDQFASYVERGGRFAAAARSLATEVAADG